METGKTYQARIEVMLVFHPIIRAANLAEARLIASQPEHHQYAIIDPGISPEPKVKKVDVQEVAQG